MEHLKYILNRYPFTEDEAKKIVEYYESIPMTKRIFIDIDMIIKVINYNKAEELKQMYDYYRKLGS